MWQVAVCVLQIVYLIMKNKFEKDAELKKKKEELYVEAKEVLKSGDASRIVGLADRMRQ